MMRILTVSIAMAIAGSLAWPAAAQGQLPRPSGPPAQKGPAPAQKGPAGAQKGPQQQQQQQQQAQPAPAPPAPYTPRAVAPPKPYADQSLAAFRKELAGVAQKKDRAALAKLVVAKDFFWLKETGNAAGKKTGIEALATALNLAAKDGSGWDMLAELSADE